MTVTAPKKWIVFIDGVPYDGKGLNVEASRPDINTGFDSGIEVPPLPWEVVITRGDELLFSGLAQITAERSDELLTLYVTNVSSRLARISPLLD